MLNPGLLLGFMLVAAIVGGGLARAARIPKVVGYLLGGVGLRYLLATGYARGRGIEDAQHLLNTVVEPLAAVKALALGLIVFTISQVLQIGHLRAVGRRIARISVTEAGCIFALVATACTIVWYLQGGGVAAIGAGILLGAIAIETAPSATLITIQEYDAKGSVSDAVLTLTAVNCVISIVIFHVVYLLLGSAGVIAPTSTGERLLWLDIVMTTLGSALLGGVLGFLLSVLYAKVALAEFLLVFLAVLIGLGAGAKALAEWLHLSFNFMLTCLFLGAVFTNVTLNSRPAFDFLRTMSAPLYAVFFVLAGFELHIAEVGSLGLLGATYVVLRMVGKYVGIRLGIAWARWRGELGAHLGLGMLCQAGVAVGLSDFLTDAWRVSTEPHAAPHPIALHFKATVLGAVVIFEMMGPVLLKSVVKRAGEVKAITLMRRAKPAQVEGVSVLRQTWEALVRAFGARPSGSSADGARNLQVRHIMRSNVKLLSASATLDEVLHFVEESNYNHFPVVDSGGLFVGMIHFSDLREVIYDPVTRDLVTAVDLAAPDEMVPADMALDELMKEFDRQDVSALVVVQSPQERRVLGIVEQRDLLRVVRRDETV